VGNRSQQNQQIAFETMVKHFAGKHYKARDWWEYVRAACPDPPAGMTGIEKMKRAGIITRVSDKHTGNPTFYMLPESEARDLWAKLLECGWGREVRCYVCARWMSLHESGRLAVHQNRSGLRCHGSETKALRHRPRVTVRGSAFHMQSTTPVEQDGEQESR
jgi:hypothetical protein